MRASYWVWIQGLIVAIASALVQALNAVSAAPDAFSGQWRRILQVAAGAAVIALLTYLAKSPLPAPVAPIPAPIQNQPEEK